jgi:hypothetical protein
MQRLARTILQPLAPFAGFALALAIVTGGVTADRVSRASAQATPTAGPTVAPAELPAAPQVDAQLFARTELYFGSERAGPDVSRREFNQFLDEAITPRFPDGLTLLTGQGQFREADGTIVEETSFVLILFYPYEDRAESSALIEQIRKLYLERFDQESVLRVDDPRPVQVSF